MLDGDLGKGAAVAAPDLKTIMPTRVNSAEADLVANIRANLKRGLPEIHDGSALLPAAHGGTALIVGGGPSLADCLDDIRNRQSQGHTIFALNGAAAWLAERGIIADILIVLDARPSNARFVAAAPLGTRLYLCSQCDPSTFDAAGDREIRVWNRNFDGLSGMVTQSPLIGAGTTVGLSAIQIAGVLGYRNIHLYGLDSSYRGGEGHAYAQPENDDDVVVDVDCDGTKYRSAIWMVRQADSFKSIAREFADGGVMLTVHGDGLLPHVARKIGEWPVKDGVLTMLYDLAASPVGFNFLEWLLTADIIRQQCEADKLRVVFAPGPNEGFRKDVLPESLRLRKQMYRNVVKPAMKLIGAEDGGIGCFGGSAPYIPKAFVELVRDGATVPRFRASTEAKAWAADWLTTRGLGAPIVITLREAEHHPGANSSIPAWSGFARWLQDRGESVVFVRDTAKARESLADLLTCPEASIDLDKRCALYERAKLNAMKCNGPYILASCVEGDVPLLIFGAIDPGHICGTAEQWKRLAGMDVGEQFPWYTDRQRIVWQGRDEIDTLAAEYKRIEPLL